MKFNWKDFKNFTKGNVEVLNRRALRTKIFRPVAAFLIFGVFTIQAEEYYLKTQINEKTKHDILLEKLYKPFREFYTPHYYKLLDLNVELLKNK